MLVRHVAAGLLSLPIIISSAGVVAQDYPVRPVRILTSSPGGGNDFLARIVAAPLSIALGQSVVVDNRASGIVGTLGAQATPDGYTLALGGSNLQYGPLLEKQGYDVVKSFDAISQLETVPAFLIVNSALPVKSVKELIAMAKAKPGQLNYGSGGSGGVQHVAGETFKTMAGIDIVRVPYKSSGFAMTGLMANEVHLIFTGSGLQHVRSGKLKALAVATDDPSELLPEVPTMASQGLPGFEFETIGFILAPRGTPKPIIERLNREIVKIMSQPQVKKQLLSGGSEAVAGTPAQLAAKLKAEDARMRKILKSLGLDVLDVKT